MSEILSEVAYFRQQQALREEAAQLGLSGFAVTATHESITARMQRSGERVLRLIEEGKHEEAQAMLNTDNWGEEEQEIPVEQAAIVVQVKEQEKERVHEPV
jgi:hypothetical protein